MKRIGGTFGNVGVRLTTGEPRFTHARTGCVSFVSVRIREGVVTTIGRARSLFYGFYHSEMERNEMAIARNYGDIVEDTFAMLLNI